MPDNAYAHVLAAIEPGQAVKAALVQTMRQQLEARGPAAGDVAVSTPLHPAAEHAESNPKTRPVRTRRTRRLAAVAVAASLVLLGVVCLPVLTHMAPVAPIGTGGGAPGADGPPMTAAPPTSGGSSGSSGSSTAEPDETQAPPRQPVDHGEQDFSALPALTVDPLLTSGGMGFEGYELYDFSEFGMDADLYAAAQAEGVMPVYRNNLPMDRYMSYPTGAGYTEQQLLERADQLAALLGWTVTGHTVYEAGPTPARDTREMSGIHVDCSGGEMTLDRNGEVGVRFSAYPDDEALAHPPAPDAPLAEHEAYLRALMEVYAPLLAHIRQPTPSAQFLGYGYAGDFPHWTYTVYDAAGCAGEAIASASLKQISFDVAEEDSGQYYFGFHLPDTSFLEPLGEYPIITEEQARAQLAGGLELSSGPQPFPGEEYIVAAELTYFQSPLMQTYIPYYKFYVQLQPDDYWHPDPDRPAGLETYATWYVPAVDPAYLIWPEGAWGSDTLPFFG